jgi:hypothetical protein
MKRLDFTRCPANARRMKRLLLLLALVSGLNLPVSAQPDAPQIKLAGIINLPDFQCAMFEEHQPARQNQCCPTQIYYWLKAGQSMRSIKVIKIDADKGIVEVRTSTNSTLSLPKLPSTPAHPAIQLQNAELYRVFDLYSAMMQRTLLRAPNLPNPLITLRAAATSRAEAAQILSSLIISNHIQLVPDGEKFVLVTPEGMETNPDSDKIKSAPSKTNEIFRAGEIDFPSAPVDQFVDVYLKLIDRQFPDDNPRPPLSASRISLTTVNSLTKEEAVYAFETVLAFANIKVVPVGTNEAKTEWISPPLKTQ